MTDVNAGEQKVEGRPGAGAELAQGMAEAKARRPRRKDIRPLVHLLPFVRAHKADGTLVMEFKRTMLIPKRGHGVEDRIEAAKSVAV